MAVGCEQDNVHKLVQKENICDIWCLTDAAWGDVKFVEPCVCMVHIMFILQRKPVLPTHITACMACNNSTIVTLSFANEPGLPNFPLGSSSYSRREPLRYVAEVFMDQISFLSPDQ